jgi:hypothetical protein
MDHFANRCHPGVCDGVRWFAWSAAFLQNLPSLLRGVFCRPIANPRRSSSHCNSDVEIEYAHSVGLGRSSAGDLLDAELVELGLQLLELLGEVLLVLAPELTSLDLGRLETVSACTLSDRSERKHTMVACCVCWVVGVENEDVLS